MAAAKTRMPVDSNALPLIAGRPSSPPTVNHGRKQPASITRPPIAASRRDRLTGRRCMVMPEAPDATSRLAVHLWPEHADVAEVAVQLAVVEPVADHELVRDREAGVVDLDLHQPARGLVQ